MDVLPCLGIKTDSFRDRLQAIGENRLNEVADKLFRGFICCLQTRSRLMKRAVLLDRDGVINHKAAEGEYVTRWEDFHFLPGAVKAISSLEDLHYAQIPGTAGQQGD